MQETRARNDRTASRPAECLSCRAWVTGDAQCFACRLGEARLTDPVEPWQLSAFLEADMAVKIAQHWRTRASERMRSQAPRVTRSKDRPRPGAPVPLISDLAVAAATTPYPLSTPHRAGS